jgi:hypothetical protein
MSHTMTEANGLTPGDLRERIAWICHGVRLAAVVWIGWIAVMVLVTWSNTATILDAYGRLVGADLTGVSMARYALACGIVAADMGVAAVIVFCVWKLFGTYLAGRVFTVDAALWLRHTGLVVLAAVAFDVLARVLIASIFAGRLVVMAAYGPLVLPQDLLHLIFGLFLLALAHIFKAAAEMAEDHAQIV